MKTIFAFGKSGIEVSIPDELNCTIAETRNAPPIVDPITALHQALDRPLGCAPLKILAKGCKTAAIAVCDITRPAPNRSTLPPLLEHLHGAGIRKEGITILIATGLHRVATREEINQIVGPEIAAAYNIVSNDARANGTHSFLGTTTRGTPAYIHKQFIDADLHITLGFIEQHLMAGFSGGRKLVAPGLAAESTIKAIHSPKFMREPQATEGSISENPLHAELLEIARMARHDFMLDVTLTPERHISGIFAGNPTIAHAAGIEFLRTTSLGRLSRRANLVITSAAGFPLDLTFYQTIKGITAAQHLVKPGGRILVISECREGVGSEEFSRKLRNLVSFEDFLAELSESPVEIDQWQLEKLALVGLTHPLFFYTPGVDKDDLGLMAQWSFPAIESAIAEASRGLEARDHIILIPEGPYTFARVETDLNDHLDINSGHED